MRALTTQSAEETIERGRDVARLLTAPQLIFLSGELGAGKTTLAKGIISGLGAAREEDVLSPTFTLVHAFRRPEPKPLKVYHIDLYRIGDRNDLATIGLEDLFDEPSIILVEWPERLGDLGRQRDWPVTKIQLIHEENGTRRIEIDGL
ncbi:MAG: tRNA (adenosine(37)-N6)-threonylcarbamoyltransferase complex ATPase subunit type 1 TsaE [Acidobacteria bacterium]|nr:tRNA (adenosine(37)-N6)-threonylcarbamoyltransferase complex ATPase subunit type 1 TsaE [Acidobacteriota bacterium]